MSIWKALGFTEKGDRPVLRCSFCNKSQRDVRLLIAGPNVYVCDDCVDICREIIAEKEEKIQPPDPGTLRCAICRSWSPADLVLVLGTGGNLCPACRGVVEEALTATPRSGSES
jgi:NAD-dependent SIR2 family protein deacetylase